MSLQARFLDVVLADPTPYSSTRSRWWRTAAVTSAHGDRAATPVNVHHSKDHILLGGQRERPGLDRPAHRPGLLTMRVRRSAP